jgi:hypothetical protein
VDSGLVSGRVEPAPAWAGGGRVLPDVPTDVPVLVAFPHALGGTTIAEVEGWLAGGGDGRFGGAVRGEVVDCGPASVAVFNQLSGTDIEVGPDLTPHGLGAAIGLALVPNDAKGIEEYLKAEGSGAHTVVSVHYRGGGLHTLNVFNDGGSVYAIDGQRGSVEPWAEHVARVGGSVRVWAMGTPVHAADRSIFDEPLPVGAAGEALPSPSVMHGSGSAGLLPDSVVPGSVSRSVSGPSVPGVGSGVLQGHGGGEGGDVEGLGRDVERLGLPSMARFPSTLEGMAEVAGARVIDTEAIADLVNRRRVGPHALRSGQLVGSHAEVRGEYGVEDVKAFMRAAGLSDQDIAKLRWTSYKAGSVYPGASLLGSLLQYLLVPGIGVAFGSKAAVGSSAVFVLAQILSAAALQPAVITWSEQIAKHRGPYVEVDKSKINYQVPLQQATRQADDASRDYAAAVGRLQGVTADAGLSVERMAAMSWTELKDRLLGMDVEQRARLGAASAEVVGHELHGKLEQLFAAEGGQQRQKIGGTWQVPVRVVRAPLSTALGFLTGAEPGDGGALAEGMRVRRVSPQVQIGLQGLVNLTVQGAGHLLAGLDEYDKVWFKSSLNIMYADLLTSAGREHWARGEPLSGKDVDAGRVGKLFSSPPRAIGAVLSKQFQAQVNALRDVPGSEEVLAQLERDLDLVAQGKFDELDAMGQVAQAMTNAASGLTWKMFYDEAWSKYTWDELRAQLVQRFTQAAHMLVLGSAAATVLPRAVAAVYGGTSHLSNEVLVALMASSTVMGFVGAVTQYKSQTLKNYNKEMPNHERESVGTQIGKGVGALYYLVKEDMASASVGERSAEVLNRSRSDFMQAATLLDALEEAERRWLFEQLPGHDAAWMSDVLAEDTPGVAGSFGAPDMPGGYHASGLDAQGPAAHPAPDERSADPGKGEIAPSQQPRQPPVPEGSQAGHAPVGPDTPTNQADSFATTEPTRPAGRATLSATPSADGSFTIADTVPVTSIRSVTPAPADMRARDLAPRSAADRVDAGAAHADGISSQSRVNTGAPVRNLDHVGGVDSRLRPDVDTPWPHLHSRDGLREAAPSQELRQRPMVEGLQPGHSPGGPDTSEDRIEPDESDSEEMWFDAHSEPDPDETWFDAESDVEWFDAKSELSSRSSEGSAGSASSEVPPANTSARPEAGDGRRGLGDAV